VIYRRVASPLHAARASAGAAYCAALAVVALVSPHPAVIAAALAATVAAGRLAGVGRELRRAAMFAVPFALVLAAINPLVSRQGLTVIARGPDLPAIGPLDITLEATAYGAVIGLRALALLLCCALYSAAVDPDEVLRGLRRISFRSALTAALATRLIPVLARDGRRLSEAQRCRPGDPPPRRTVLAAVARGALDRAVDVAATLELRGYAGARRPPRSRRPWSRHDLAFAAAAAGLVVLAVGGRVAGIGDLTAYPAFSASLGPAGAALAVALLLVALLPFADRRGVAR
jgi:energy-coupling factor transport system permease protein